MKELNYILVLLAFIATITIASAQPAPIPKNSNEVYTTHAAPLDLPAPDEPDDAPNGGPIDPGQPCPPFQAC